MFDTHAIARALTDAGIEPAHADAITVAVRQAAEHDNAAEPLATTRDLAGVRADLAVMESRITWRFIGALLAVASIQTAILIATMRLLAAS